MKVAFGNSNQNQRRNYRRRNYVPNDDGIDIILARILISSTLELKRLAQTHTFL